MEDKKRKIDWDKYDVLHQDMTDGMSSAEYVRMLREDRETEWPDNGKINEGNEAGNDDINCR